LRQMTYFSHDSIKSAEARNLLAVSIKSCRILGTLLEVSDRFSPGNRANSIR